MVAENNKSKWLNK